MEFTRIAASLVLILCYLAGRASANDSDIVLKAFKSVSTFNLSDVCGTTSGCDTIRTIKLNSRNLSGAVNWRVLAKLAHLKTLDLSDNSLSGRIKEDLWTMNSLTDLNLAKNVFGGSLNFNWGIKRPRYSALQTLNLSFNRLRTFDDTLNLSGFKNLMVVDLSNNQIIGNKVLAELFNLESLTNISLARNSLLSIPLLSKNSSRVKYLDLSNSDLSGTISSLARISSLLYLDLSHNNLSGSFPIDAQKLQFLNISFNNFSGRANDEDVRKFGPAAFIKSGLCNNALKTHCSNKAQFMPPSPSPLPHYMVSHSLRRGAMVAIISVAAGIVAATAFFLLCFYRSRKARAKKKWVVPKPPFTWKTDRSITESGPFSFETDSGTWVADIKDSTSAPVIIFEKPLLDLTFSDLLALTSHFSKESQLAEGQNGPVYRAILPGEIHIAIKVLERAKDLNAEEAVSKLDALGRLKHPNILPLLGYCIAGKEKLLIYEFMQNGDLHQWLHELPGMQPNTEDWSMDTWEEQQTEGGAVSGERMGWITRHKIALGIARALAFLHHGSSSPIVHGGLTPFNVLLDDNFETRVAESGIRDLLKISAHPEILNYVYAAPESVHTLDEGAKADVYSFGVVLLELVTGRRASDGGFPDGFNGNLVGWVRSLMKEKHGVSALNPRLSNAAPTTQMLDALRIGYLCTAESPSKRPSMQQVVGLLKDIRPDQAQT